MRSTAPSESSVDRTGRQPRDLDQLAAERVLTDRRVAFVGNCQMFRLSKLYGSSLTTGMRGASEYVNPHVESDPACASILAEADFVIWQVSDAASRIARSSLPIGTRVIDVPLVSAVFLWPFAGRPHPKNERVPHAPNGPFDPELGDTYLNSLIAQGVTPDEAVSRYLSLDFRTRTNLDRVYELWFEAQGRRDRATGFAFRDSIVDSFRTEQTFLTPHHPGLGVFSALAKQVFERMGFSDATIARVLGPLQIKQFWPDCHPVHPAVAEHFGLNWCGPCHRYPLRHEGTFTFAEFVHRYVAYDWNEPLAEGIWCASGRDQAFARRRLEEGLRRSPDSSLGYAFLSQICLREGDADAALAAARAAVRLDEQNPHAHFAVGQSLLRSGLATEGEVALCRAVRAAPTTATASLELARLYRSQKRFDEAHSVICDALEVFPHDFALLVTGAKALIEACKLDDAEALLREAIAVKPIAAEPHWLLGDVLALKVRRAVVADYQAMVGRLPDNANAQAGLGLLQRRIGDHVKAEAAFRSAVALCPEELGSRIQLATAISRQGRTADALSMAIELERDRPDDQRVRTLLTHLRKEPREAETTDHSEKSAVPPTALGLRSKALENRISLVE